MSDSSTVAKAISDWLILGAHHSTPEAQRAMAGLIDAWLMEEVDAIELEPAIRAAVTGADPYHLFLDDERMPAAVTWVVLPSVPWTIVRSYDAFVDTITRRGLPAHIAFDHDLGVEADSKPDDVAVYNAAINGMLHGQQIDYDWDRFVFKTGYHCARWLVEYCLDRDLDLPWWVCHSMNPLGRTNITAMLKAYTRSRTHE